MTTKQIRKLVYGSPAWNREANALARSYAPAIHPCKKCTWPVAKGYCCPTCGTGTPDCTKEQDAEFEAFCKAKRRA